MSGATSELAHLFRALKAPLRPERFPAWPTGPGRSPGATRSSCKLYSRQRSPRAKATAERTESNPPGFPARKTLEEFDFTFQRSVKKQIVEHLGQLDFLHARQNVILLGPPGTGKTHVATALGVRACLAGQRVQFATATAWVAKLGEAKRQGQLETELKRLALIPMLVVDEVGYIPFDPEAANLMFALVSSRYERASMIVTSNKPFSAWGEIFGDDAVATTMIDRLIHHADISASRATATASAARTSAPAQPNQQTPPNPSRSRQFPTLAYGSLQKPPAHQPSSGLVFNRQNWPTFQPALTTPARRHPSRQPQSRVGQ